MKDLSKTENVLGTSSSGPVFFRESKMYTKQFYKIYLSDIEKLIKIQTHTHWY